MISFRKATEEDIPTLRHWDMQPHVIASDPEEWDWDEAFARNDLAIDMLIAELENRPIGFVQIMNPQLEQTHYWGEIGPDHRAIDIWIGEADDLNKGYGTIMMKMAFDRCFADSSVNSILIDPLITNLKAHRFYRRLGFQFVEEREFNGEDCFVLELTRANYKNPSASM